MNIAIISGRLARDPELRQTKSNKATCTFCVAVRDGVDQEGKEKAQFINCVAWEKNAENIGKYFRKGSPILVTGSIEQKSYEKDGIRKRYDQIRVSRFEFMGGKKEESPDIFAEWQDEDVDLPF